MAVSAPGSYEKTLMRMTPSTCVYAHACKDDVFLRNYTHHVPTYYATSLQSYVRVRSRLCLCARNCISIVVCIYKQFPPLDPFSFMDTLSCIHTIHMHTCECIHTIRMHACMHPQASRQTCQKFMHVFCCIASRTSLNCTRGSSGPVEKEIVAELLARFRTGGGMHGTHPRPLLLNASCSQILPLS